MSDLSAALSTLRRPRLLVRAARHGLSDYSRPRDLARLAGVTATATPARIVRSLLELEERAEQTRLARDGTYCAHKHIELLVALMAESQVLAETPRAQDRAAWRPKVV